MLTRRPLLAVFAILFAAVATRLEGVRAQQAPAPLAEIDVDGRPSRVVANDRLALTVRSLGGVFAQVLMKDDPDRLNPLQGLGHFVCVDGFGPVSPEERAAGLPGHGEAHALLWETKLAHKSGSTGTLTQSVKLPILQEVFTRTLRMIDGENVIYVQSQLESLLGFDRPVNWGEHDPP